MKIECPYCHQAYEIEESLIGQELECGVCKKKFTVPGATLPQPAPTVTVNTNVKQGAAIGAWVCLGLGVILNIFSNWMLFLSLPLYLTAFILSIVAMSQRRLGSGLASLILTILLPPIIIFVNIAWFAGALKTAAEEKSATSDSVSKPEEQETAAEEKSATSDSVSKPEETSVPADTPADTPTKPVAKQGSRRGRGASPADTPTKPVAKSAAIKEITELCGIKFGSTFARNNNPRNGQLTNGETMYAVNPSKRFMGFTKYYVLITPTSEKVYSIWMQWNFENNAAGYAEFDRVAAVLENHYQIKGERELSIDPELTFKFDNGRLMLKLDTGFQESTLEIRGYSEELEDLKEKENKEAAIKATDTSAL